MIGKAVLSACMIGVKQPAAVLEGPRRHHPVGDLVPLVRQGGRDDDRFRTRKAGGTHGLGKLCIVADKDSAGHAAQLEQGQALTGMKPAVLAARRNGELAMVGEGGAIRTNGQCCVVDAVSIAFGIAIDDGGASAAGELCGALCKRAVSRFGKRMKLFASHDSRT
jgi:hypothetical protein